MGKRLPRREMHFDTAETGLEFEYKPAKARDKRWAEIYKGKKPGSVIAIQQKMGIEAALASFEIIEDNGTDKDVRQIADVLSVAALGTAYHTFGVPSQHELMYRKISLPVMLDPETEHRTTRSELVEQTRAGFSHAAQLAADIENLVLGGYDPYKSSQRIGRALATTGFTLATLKDHTYSLRGDEEEMQYAAWKSSRNASVRALELTGAIGARPTIAQIPDSQSPFRRYMHDTTEFMNSNVHGILVEEVGRVADREANRQMSLGRLDGLLF